MVSESLGHPTDSHVLGVGLVSCLFHSPTGSPQDIPRTPTLGSCPSVLSVLQSHWESQGLPPLTVVPVSCLSYSPTGSPKDSHPWQLSQCPICPTVPLGVPRTPTLGSCPSVLSVPQSYWKSLGHPKDSHPWELSCLYHILLGVSGTPNGPMS